MPRSTESAKFSVVRQQLVAGELGKAGIDGFQFVKRSAPKALFERPDVFADYLKDGLTVDVQSPDSPERPG
jgi:hypothetical protein